MRVLQVNKFLYGGAGAETVMFRTTELLRAHGHDVSYFAMQDPRNIPCAESVYFPPGRYYGAEQSAGSRLRSAAASVYSLTARRSLRRLIEAWRPDVAHLHNVYHQLTLSVVDELRARRVPIVMTVHDLKPVCPSYTGFTDHSPCHRCVGGNPGHVVVHRCIKDSRSASIIAAVEAFFTRSRGLYDHIDAFIVPSRYYIDTLIEGGLRPERMQLVPNFVADQQFGEPPRLEGQRGSTALFVGRLEETKGVRVLLDAAQALGGQSQIVIVGRGPLEAEVRKAAAAGLITYLGSRDWSEIARLMDSASALVVPSIWEENCPMVVLEAGARGCPVIASDRGGLRELVAHEKDGLLFPAGDADALTAAIVRLASNPELSIRLGENRRKRVREANTARGYLDAVLNTYRGAMDRLV